MVIPFEVLFLGNNVTSPPAGFPGSVSSGFQTFLNAVYYIEYLIVAAAVDIARGGVAVLLAVGFLLWGLHLNRRMGIGFIEGGIAVFILFQFILPAVVQTPPLF